MISGEVFTILAKNVSKPSNRGNFQTHADLSSWRRTAARLLRSIADRFHPIVAEGVRERLDLHHPRAVPGPQRLDWNALDRNETPIRYKATDPVWHDVDGDGCLATLREHVRRLCTATLEIVSDSRSGDWEGVAYNLKLAYSLTDLFVDTDIDGAGLWCGPVADYEDANSEVTAKHLAATIVFTFVWSAYERAVAIPESSRIGKGSRGRDLVAGIDAGHIPHFREIMFKAIELDHGGTDFRHPEMRRMLEVGSLPGIAAEHLRQFRNRVIHGDIPKPEPEDWGVESKYVADQDSALRKFHANTRLLLLLVQMLVSGSLREDLELSSLLEDSCNAKFALRHLHCRESSKPDQLELDYAIACWQQPRWC